MWKKCKPTNQSRKQVLLANTLISFKLNVILKFSFVIRVLIFEALTAILLKIFIRIIFIDILILIYIDTLWTALMIII